MEEIIFTVILRLTLGAFGLLFLGNGLVVLRANTKTGIDYWFIPGTLLIGAYLLAASINWDPNPLGWQFGALIETLATTTIWIGDAIIWFSGIYSYYLLIASCLGILLAITLMLDRK